MQKRTSPALTSKFNLHVIEFPYFTKELGGGYGKPKRCGFFVASRKNAWCDEWEIQRQFYTRRSDSMSVSNSDFDHQPTIKVSSIEDLIAEYKVFELDCVMDGMTKHEREESSYTYGAPPAHAFKLLGVEARI